MKNKLIAAALLLCLAVSLCGCAEKITKEELKEVLPALVDNSFLLNEIYFGEGFLPSGEAGKDSDVYGYYYVNGDQHGFYSISEIKEATEKIFTPEYAAILYTAAFEGVATEETVVAPRYMEGELGILQSMHTTVYDLADRSYDYSTLQIVKNRSDRAVVEIETVADGDRQTVELIVVRYIDAETGEKTYRLDSPTY